MQNAELILWPFLEEAPFASAMFDTQMCYLRASCGWRQDYGLGKRSLCGISHYEIFPEIPERWKEAHRQALKGQFLHCQEDCFERADGSVLWLRWQIGPWYTSGGTIGGIVMSTEDITARKRIEEQLRVSEERYRSLVEATADSVWLGTPLDDGIYVPAWSKVTGQTPEEAATRWGEAVHPDDRTEVGQAWSSFIENGGVYQKTYRLRRYDGEYRWYSVSGVAICEPGGRIREWVGTYNDVTERKEIEEELRLAKAKLTEEKLYLEQDVEDRGGFGEIIGWDTGLKDAIEKVKSVARTDSTVLLLGETGTGKELIARSIHKQSRRADKPFIKLNCAAIPTGLLESELFGAEKGAFTGAISQRIGRIELADQGTLFLDEIGEIAPSLQPKLLRVLQEQEFERLGGIRTIKVNFRLIAATNRDLPAETGKNQFRPDLYYRLAVFPIRMPALRERKEDIPKLVEHFVREISRKAGKSIKSIPKPAMDALTNWHWPGNVRELENFIERSIILSPGTVLATPLAELTQPVLLQRAQDDATLVSINRQHIMKALQECGGRVSGPRGAAAKLGLKRTTLQSKMKKLGIVSSASPRSEGCGAIRRSGER
jgi:PAS domain S-box-containing protein